MRRSENNVRNFAPHSIEDEERIDPIRVAIMGGIAAVIILLVVLVVSLGRMTSQRNSYRAQVEAGNDFESRYTNAAANNDHLSGQITSLTNERNHYRALAEANATAADHGQGTSAGNDGQATTGNEQTATTPADDFPRDHVVSSGQNLTVIARMHYGPGRDGLRYWQHIRDYNNLTTDGVQVSQRLIIPAPPPPLP